MSLQTAAIPIIFSLKRFLIIPSYSDLKHGQLGQLLLDPTKAKLSGPLHAGIY
jgi:hypothetical protein